MADGSFVDATGGLIDVDATDNIVLSLLRTSTDVAVDSTSGSILDLASEATANALDIIAANALLHAATGIATLGNPLELSVDKLEGSGGTGGIFIDDLGGLTIGSISSAALPAAATIVGLLADSTIRVTTTGFMTVTEDITSTEADVELEAIDSANTGEDFTLTNDAAISAATEVRLLAGDDFQQDADTGITAGTSITIKGDFGNADSGVGSDITIHGTINAPDVMIYGEADHDVIVIDAQVTDAEHTNRISGHVQVFGGEETDWITVNRLHSRTDEMDLDGQGGRDLYFINTRGSDTDQLTRVYDTGASGVDEITINGTSEDDVFLLRAMAIEGPAAPNTGFVAKLNEDGAEVERFNYRGIEGITLNTLYGDDCVASDDALVVFTINGGVGNDRFQIGQVFKSQRDDNEQSANIAHEDIFATIEITRGWLSNGITAPMTINGGEGNDEFTVFHNKAVLSLNGGDGDDSFTVRAFALAGSQEDQRARTDMKGDAGVDLIRYAVNAPVGIDGGDGLDTVIVIGTEFSDDFVITDQGVFGGGLFVTYVNIEKLKVDEAEGDDRCFVLSTSADLVTEIDGGLGSDTFFVGGSPSDAPIPVVSNDLKGHSGVILHNVESSDTLYDGITVEGISANVADNDEFFIVVTESGGVSTVTEDIHASTVGLAEEGWNYDTYTVALTRKIEGTEVVTISVLVQQPAPEDGAKGYKTIEFWNPNTDKWEETLQLTFTASSWQTAQTVKFRATHDVASEGKQFALINHRVESSDPGSQYHQLAMRSVKVQINDDDRAGAIVTPTGRTTQVIEGGMTDTYAVVLTRAPSADVIVNLDSFFDQVLMSRPSVVDNKLTFTPRNYNIAQIVTVLALNDTLKEGFHTDYISHTLASGDAGSVLSASYQIDGDPLVAGVNAIPTTNPLDTVLLEHEPVVDADGFAETLQVTVDDEVRASERFGVFGNTLVFFGADGETPEAISGTVEVSYDYVEAGYNGSLADRVVVDVADNEVASVVVIESDGSTDVVEGGATDTYQVVLTKQPTADVTIDMDAIKTRTTGSNNSGNFAYFQEQVLVNDVAATTLTFTTTNWNTPQTVAVSAIDDTIIDGDDTQVFVPGQATVNEIRGPLFIEGASGGGSLSLPKPLMLTGELNRRLSDGNVVSFESGTGPGAIEHMTVETVDLQTVAADLSTLIGRTLEMTTGSGTDVVLDASNPDQKFDRFWMIKDVVVQGDNTVLTLQNPSQVDPSKAAVTAPNEDGNISEYAITSLSVNFFADERKQVDYLFVYDQDSVADDVGALTSDEFGGVTKGRITGLGMGPDVDLLAGSNQPGGITYGDLEVVQVNLGSGDDKLTVDYATISADHATHRDSEFYTLTMVNTGEGDDEVTVNLIAGESGAFALNTQAGNDAVNGEGSTAPLIVFGETGDDEIHGGSGDDILFGDYGQVDYLDGDGFVVTRLGHTWAQNPVNPPVTSATGTTLTDSTAEFPTTYGGLVGLSVQAISSDGTVQYRTITANTETEITVDTAWDVTPDATYFYRVSMLPEDQTDGKVRGPSVIWSIDEAIGGTDNIDGNGGNDIIIGGAAGDTVHGGAGNDLIAGDNARLDFVPLSGTDGPTALSLAQTTSPGVGATDWLYGEDDSDTIFGGQAGDTIDAGDGTNIVLGDHGAVTFQAADTLQSILSTDNAQGGNDIIKLGIGTNTVVGGTGTDDIDAGQGRNVVLGDSGSLTYGTGGWLQKAETTTTADGAADDIDVAVSTTGNTNLIIGGQAGDTIDAGDGTNIVLGDHGAVTFQAADTLQSILSTDSAEGGADQITTSNGGDVIVGGQAGDTIDTGDGNKVVLGDDGTITYDVNGTINDINSISTKDNGGTDGITTGAGDDIVIGGRFGDTIDAGSGNNVVIGDSGHIAFLNGVPTRIETIEPDDGGGDTITTLTGDDIIFGGTKSDTIHAGAGVDVIFGDQGEVLSTGGANTIVTYSNNYVPGYEPAPWYEGYSYTATCIRDIYAGAGDLIYGEAGGDYILGQQGTDVIFGGAGDDDIYGGHNQATGFDAGDIIDGGTGNDVIAGDNASIQRTDDHKSPRFQALVGTSIYSEAAGGDGLALVTGASQANPDGVHARTVILYDSSHTPDTTTFGDDLIAGGADDDLVFGQLGNDTVHGDGQITDPGYELITLETTTSGSDIGGDDYIEGNGGDDKIYGGLGQDDLIGGSSSLFGLTTHDQRPDGSDTIYGGNGDLITRNNMGDESATGHARDADMILGDNGNIYRLVGTNGSGSGKYLTFNYDTYSGTTGLKIIPRAAKLIDYTPGGSDYDSVEAATDIGAADTIHGESGDDFIYGMVGDDVLFGEGQDDDIIGGYGNDWISGGTGDDGVLGDDGRIYTSRNSTDGELLYGIDGFANNQLGATISTPGKIQQSTINDSGRLKKTVNVTPFNLEPDGGDKGPLFDPLYADDIIYGGLGNDFLHGGAGDDAISGAEALPTYYDAPLNEGDVLGYGGAKQWGDVAKAGEFAWYNEYTPLEKINDFLLNFEAFDDVEARIEDGNDVIFGDLGNDWIVGGTGKDHLYGGYGDDLSNADDNQDTGTIQGKNDVPDTDPTYEDIAYAGAGRDVLIANTGGDRLIDWVGEFNSYVVPFAAFGAATVSRALQPALHVYLYNLSESDGADQNFLDGDQDRNYEPYGELGLVLQKDSAWHDQTGAPDDPQPGNIPGGRRDVLRSASFNSGTADGFVPDSGTWTVTSGRYQVAPTTLGGDAVSVFYVDQYIPTYFEILATIRTVKPTGGYKANAYLIFDYQSPADFKYAGVNVSTNQLEMGYRDAQGWHTVVQRPYTTALKPDTDYNVFLALNGSTATLVVDSRVNLTYTFAPRTDEYGFTYFLQAGMVGIGANNAKGQIDNVTVQRIPPEVTLDRTVDFSSGLTDLFGLPSSGTWNLADGRYDGTAPSGGSAVDLLTLEVAPASYVQLNGTLATAAQGGFVFDYYGPEDFKFVTLSVETKQILLGHHTLRAGWVIDAALIDTSLAATTDYTLGVTLKGTTVSVTLNEQAGLSYAFNALVTDGVFGMLARNGLASFNEVNVKTDDPAFRDSENHAPVANNDIASTNRDTPVSISVLANDTDADGNALSVTALTPPASGTAVLNPDGTVTYTPTNRFVGTDSFTYQTNDGQSQSNTATVTIQVKVSTAVAIAATVPIAAEPNGAGKFEVTRTGDTSSDLTVFYTVGGTATAGTDYAALVGSVLIPAGSASAFIELSVRDDSVYEGDETVVLTLASNAAYEIDSPSSATVNIADDELPPLVTITPATAVIPEAGGRTDFLVTRSDVGTSDLIVTYSVAGTATAGSDYEPLTGTVTIPAGQQSATFSLVAIDDTQYEPDETVVVSLKDGSMYDVGAESASTVTIKSDDVQPPLPAAPTSLTGRAGNGGIIDLTWADNATNEIAYVLEWSLDGTNWAEWSSAASLPENTTSFRVAGLQKATMYYFRVKAINAAGSSGYSNVLKIRSARK